MKIIEHSFTEFVNESIINKTKINKPKSLFDDIEDVWNSIKDRIHKKFNDGYATCTFASATLANAKKQGKFKHCDLKIVEGEWRGDTHWFVLIEILSGRILVDLGNNLEPKALSTGIITPIITNVNDPNYSIIEEYSVKEYLEYYQTIKNL